jgi:rhodanese-related sulfurtransferase
MTSCFTFSTTSRLARRAVLHSVLGAAWAAAAGCSLAGDGPDRSVTLEAAREALAKGSAVVVDIREPDEHARGVAAGARLLPMSQLGRRLQELPRDPAQPLLLICNTQNRSSRVAEALRAQGYTDVRYVQGGMSGWASRGWPLVAPLR